MKQIRISNLSHKIARIKPVCLRAFKQGFTLIELLVVLTILSMMAGIVLPSASMFLRKNTIEAFSHNIGILCRETFYKSIVTGRPLLVSYNKTKQELAVFTDSKTGPVMITSMFLRPLKIPKNCELQWPDKGWKVIPEGFCESAQIRIRDKTTSELIILKFRPYDARLENTTLHQTSS